MNILAPISAGELLDKLSILYIKAERIKDPDKLKHINKEVGFLEAIIHTNSMDKNIGYKHLMTRLQIINNDIWELEDGIRELSAANQHDDKFIQTAKSIHTTNDKRAQVKTLINTVYNSNIVEVKSYKE